MDVRVHESGQQDVVAEVLHPGAVRHLGVVGQDGVDRPARDVDRGGPRAPGCDDARRAQYQLHVRTGHPCSPLHEFNELLKESSLGIAPRQDPHPPPAPVSPPRVTTPGYFHKVKD